jgi:hypothetical protein
VVRTPEPHHLEGECLLAEVVQRAEPDRQVDLPEGLDALARLNAMEQRHAGPQLVQPDPQQAQRVRVEDVEAATSIHQDLREPRIPDDRVDHQRVLAWVGDAVRVILAAEGDGVFRPVEEGGRSLLHGEGLMPFPLALAVGHVDGRPPEDEEDVLHSGEAACVAVTPIFLRIAVLRGGGVAVKPLEHVATLEGVVDRRLVVGTWLLQYVVENPRTSRGRPRAPSSWVNS